MNWLKAPDAIGIWIVKWFGLKNRHLILALIGFLIGWAFYWLFAMRYISFEYRFIPDFLFGFLTCLVILKLDKVNEDVKHG